MIGKTSYCKTSDKKFKQEALKVMPVISSAQRCTEDRFQGLPLTMKQMQEDFQDHLAYDT